MVYNFFKTKINIIKQTKDSTLSICYYRNYLKEHHDTINWCSLEQTFILLKDSNIIDQSFYKKVYEQFIPDYLGTVQKLRRYTSDIFIDKLVPINFGETGTVGIIPIEPNPPYTLIVKIYKNNIIIDEVRQEFSLMLRHGYDRCYVRDKPIQFSRHFMEFVKALYDVYNEVELSHPVK